MITVHACKKCLTRWLPVVLRPPTKKGGPLRCPRCGGPAPEVPLTELESTVRLRAANKTLEEGIKRKKEARR